MLFIFALSSQESFPKPRTVSSELLAIISHLLLFGVLAALLVLGLTGRWRFGMTIALAAVILSTGYGLTDELHQSFVPGRSSSLLDIVVDTIGASIAVAMIVLRRRRFSASRNDRARSVES